MINLITKSISIVSIFFSAIIAYKTIKLTQKINKDIRKILDYEKKNDAKILYIVPNGSCKKYKKIFFKNIHKYISSFISHNPLNHRFFTINSDQDIFFNIFNDIENSGKTKIVLFIKTLGGKVSSCSKIFRMIEMFQSKNGKVHVVINKFAYSSGTLITLASDKIYMSTNALLSPCNSQFITDDDRISSNVYDIKNIQKQGVELIINYNDYIKSKDIYKQHLQDILLIKSSKQYKKNNLSKNVVDMFCGKYPHEFAFSRSNIQDMGIYVSNIPENLLNINKIMDRYHNDILNFT